MTSKSVLLAAAVSIFLIQNVSPVAVLAERLYTWTDKNGVVHITSSPTEAERAKARKSRNTVSPSTSKSGTTDVKKEEHKFIQDVRSAQKYEKDQIDKARKDAINVLNYGR